ncbi:hypothetical protein DICVIV_07153 [Dictyocaulus viviparus]|uniref:Uncharacterized protein n=1 Tax=Dictyocaulus viviparus TaxID=29172 RepID=A0A0D8XQ65_DICVI|nr:hypothetical protein DICVIV_07153 [Dictyocaulus viviparus]
MLLVSVVNIWYFSVKQTSSHALTSADFISLFLFGFPSRRSRRDAFLLLTPGVISIPSKFQRQYNVMNLAAFANVDSKQGSQCQQRGCNIRILGLRLAAFSFYAPRNLDPNNCE